MLIVRVEGRKGRIRLVSVRRARKEERELYHESQNIEKVFDKGKDVTSHLDLSRAHRPGHEQRRVNVDFPSWITP